MRPFHLGGRVWVDLDAVQEMSHYDAGWGLTIRWHCAFQDKPREETFADAIKSDDELKAEIFDPFFAAWTANAKA